MVAPGGLPDSARSSREVIRKGTGDRPAADDRRRGAVGGGAVPGVLRGADREREDAGGVRAGRRAIPRVVRGARARAARRLSAPSRRIPDAPGSVPTVKAAPGRDPHARGLARRQPGPPGEPSRGCPGAEARRHQGRDAGPLASGGEEAPREDRHRRPGRAPRPGAALGDALQLRAGERGVGDAAAGLLRAGEPRLAEAPRERREAPRRSGAPPGGRGPRRLHRGGRAPGAEGGALPDRGPGGAPADGPGARSAARSGDGQAARRSRGAAALDVLSHIPGDGDHGVPVERGDPRGTRSRSRGTRRRRRRSSTTGRRKG